MLTLDEDQVRAALSWDALIPAMERALADFSTGRAVMPPREVMVLEEGQRHLGLMPAAIGDAMSVKLVSFYPKNAGTEHPTHMAVIVLFDAATGEPLAVLDGRLVTEKRTAAVSAVATKLLAPHDSSTLAILGSGVQAHAHAEALARVRAFREVRVWSPTRAHAERFAREHERARAAESAEAAVRGADVVVVATNAREPVLRGAWLKGGAHVNAVGACRPTWRELDDDAMRNAVVVDSRVACGRESGDVIQSKAEIAVELGELVAGTKSVDSAGTTVFKSVGLAVEDLAAARLAFDHHRRRERPA